MMFVLQCFTALTLRLTFHRWNLCPVAVYRFNSPLSLCIPWARGLGFLSPTTDTICATTSLTTSAHAQTTLASIADLHPMTICPRAQQDITKLAQDLLFLGLADNITLLEIPSIRPSTRFPTIRHPHLYLSPSNRRVSALHLLALLAHVVAVLLHPTLAFREDQTVLDPLMIQTCIRV